MGGQYKQKDHFYLRAKQEQYLSRAAYKLLELDKKYSLLKRGSRVLDLGCFPGGWLQVAAEKIGQEGVLVGVDVKPITLFESYERSDSVTKPLLILGDIKNEEFQQELLKQSGGGFDTILSDLCPSLSGIRFRDVVKSAELVEITFYLANKLLRSGGNVVAKVFPGQETDDLSKRCRTSFVRFDRECLKSSRKTSDEFYFVARNFIGASKV